MPTVRFMIEEKEPRRIKDVSLAPNAHCCGFYKELWNSDKEQVLIRGRTLDLPEMGHCVQDPTEVIPIKYLERTKRYIDFPLLIVTFTIYFLIYLYNYYNSININILIYVILFGIAPFISRKFISGVLYYYSFKKYYTCLITEPNASIDFINACNMYCQLCNEEAPFLDKQGNPFFEVHHIDYLSKGGTDTIDNVVALCPNCHRKMHHLELKDDVEKIKRKAIENMNI